MLVMTEGAPMEPTDEDLGHLRRCIDLARTGLESGDQPFGSVLVLDGEELAADHNRIAGGDRTQHPEFALARWAAANLTPVQRAQATVYTSGEHCPMCAAAHGWVGLGRIVFATSSRQLTTWLEDLGVAPPPVRPLPITDIVPDVEVAGPVAELADEVHALHVRYHAGD
jgi:tRNA(Arg) A34 adenosine deaminase TadA